jgi:hypothetical protein
MARKPRGTILFIVSGAVVDHRPALSERHPPCRLVKVQSWWIRPSKGFQVQEACFFQVSRRLAIRAAAEAAGGGCEPGSFDPGGLDPDGLRRRFGVISAIQLGGLPGPLPRPRATRSRLRHCSRRPTTPQSWQIPALTNAASFPACSACHAISGSLRALPSWGRYLRWHRRLPTL